MRRQEPRLDSLAAHIARIEDDGDESYFCAHERWYKDNFYGPSIKSQLVRLVGWYAENPDLRTQKHYDVAHLALYRLLPDCRNCPCVERLGGPIARLADLDRVTAQGAANKRAMRKVVWDKTDGHCVYCGKALHPFDDFTIDHLKPKAKGGDDSWDNLVPACMKCNGKKGDREPNAFVLEPKSY